MILLIQDVFLEGEEYDVRSRESECVHGHVVLYEVHCIVGISDKKKSSHTIISIS